MNKITALFVALLYTFISTSAFSYGGPTVNDRNVQPLYGPKLAKKKFIKVPSDINIEKSILGTIIINQKDIQISQQLIKNIVWRKAEQGKGINLVELEQNVKNLNSINGIRASAVLKKNKNNIVDLIINLNKTDPSKARVRVDNSGSRTSGFVKSTSTLSYDNFFNMGESFGLKQVHTAANGTNYYEINNKMPVGIEGSSLAFRVAKMRYDLGEYATHPVQRGLEGGSSFIDVNFDKPLIYGDNLNLNLGLGLFRGSFQEYKNMGAQTEKDARIQRGDLSLDLSFRDNLFKQSATNARIIFSHGKNIYSDSGVEYSPANDQEGSNGKFSKINPAFSRIEKINDKTNLLLKFKGQYAFDNLDGTEEFSLGGTYNVRGYPNNEGSGDTGYITTLELQRSIQKNLMVSLLFDYGKIWTHKDLEAATNGGAWTPFGYSSLIPVYDIMSGGIAVDWKIIPGSTLKMQVIDHLGISNRGKRDDGQDFDRTTYKTKLLLSFTQNF